MTETDPTPPAAELAVAIDLLAEDALLREAIAEPLSVRLPTGKVISVPHMKDWPHLATRLVMISAYDQWARLVLSDDDYKAFTDADLRTYQIERITEAATAAADVSPGKPTRSSGSHASTRRP